MVKRLCMVLTLMAVLVSSIGPAASYAATAPAAPPNTVRALSCVTSSHSVPGAAARWTECKANGQTTVSGWVKDTSADGRCGLVYAFFTNGHYHQTPRACPKGTVKDFTWTERASDAQIYLTTVPANS